jgi:hypothetical protein
MLVACSPSGQAGRIPAGFGIVAGTRLARWRGAGAWVSRAGAHPRLSPGRLPRPDAGGILLGLQVLAAGVRPVSRAAPGWSPRRAARR